MFATTVVYYVLFLYGNKNSCTTQVIKYSNCFYYNKPSSNLTSTCQDTVGYSTTFKCKWLGRYLSSVIFFD